MKIAMSGSFMPINLQTSVAPQDTSYLRQNQIAAKPRGNNNGQNPTYIPNNNELKTMTRSALELQKQNVFMDRGSILNILV